MFAVWDLPLFPGPVALSTWEAIAQCCLYTPCLHYLIAHLLPLLGVTAATIEKGTSWKYFGTELLLFTSYLVCAQRQFLGSWLGLLITAVHLPLHFGLTLGDYLAHDAVVKAATVPKTESMLRWGAAKFGLALDTSCHISAAALLACGSRPPYVYVWPVAAGLALTVYLRTNWQYVKWRSCRRLQELAVKAPPQDVIEPLAITPTVDK